MNASQQIKDLSAEDPLFSRVKTEKRNKEVTTRHQSSGWQWALILLVVGFSFLGYYLFQAQQRINRLNTNLSESQNQLTSVTRQLQDSGSKMVQLEQGLTESQSNLRTQGRELRNYKNLYSEVKVEQEQQTRDLQAVSLEKADQSQVDSLKSETAGIKKQLQTVDDQVNQADSSISELREMTNRNRSDIGNTREALGTVRQTAELNTKQLADVKHSLEREYYNFELQEKGGYMKVFEVALRLKDTDSNRQRYELDVIAGGKRLRKKDHYIHEPIYFYVEGIKKPYEIVVTKVNKKYVVGYLSVPKK